MATSISSSIIACLKSFNEFIEDIKYPQEVNAAGLVASAWEDELGRLRLWAANIGAHQTGQSSLDFRLRDASHVREQIIKLLLGLLRRLQDARDVLADDEESNDDEAADDALGGGDPKTEIEELQESLATNINCLFQMSMLVRKPAQHDVYLGSKRADVAAFEPFDYNHVREKYPKADDALAKRLGKAITRRRKYLKYRERHATKLRQGISKVDPGARDFQDFNEREIMTLGTRGILSDTIVTDFEQRNTDFDDKSSNTGISQTSYAPTLLSGGNVAIPRPPKTSLGGVPFECPYCFYVITVDGTRSWNKHVFQDLQPYICISPTCTSPDKLYSTRREWLHHSNMFHAAAMMDDVPPKERKGVATCPLCKEEIESGKQFDRHLARHLQELALFILSGGEEDSDVSEDQDAESGSGAKSAHLAVSHDGSESPEGLLASPVGYSAAIEDIDSSHGKQNHREDEDKEKARERIILFEQKVSDRQRLLGPEHQDTLASMAELAEVYCLQKEYEKAAPLLKHVIEVRKELLGEGHPETLHSIYELAQIYIAQKHWADAELLCHHALKGYTEKLGPQHEKTLRVMHRLASIYIHDCKLAEAEVMCQQVLSGSEKSLGPGHQLTLSAANRLGDVYEKQGRFAEAEDMYQQALSGFEKVFGREDRRTFSTALKLAFVYDEEGMHAKADDLYQKVLRDFRKALGPGNVMTLRAVQDLGDFYEEQDKLTEEREKFQEYLKNNPGRA